ncbi:MAG: ATP synthase F1 subunit delta [Planctomycetes bacterium]|nr:ATP synthase F1 subunit delta [Planctomycetota bacterium]
MPLDREIIRNYSDALLRAALAEDCADRVARDADALLSFSAEEELFRLSGHFLRSSRVLPAPKRAMLNDLASLLDLCPLTGRWLALAARHNRFTLVGEMVQDFMVIYRERTGHLLATVRSAQPLSPEQLTALKQALETRLEAGVRMDELVDPSLIAGIRVEVAGMVWDSSVAGALRRVSFNFR